MPPAINPMIAYRVCVAGVSTVSGAALPPRKAFFTCRAMNFRVSHIADTPKQNHAPNDCASRNGNPGRCPMPAIVPHTRIILWKR